MQVVPVESGVVRVWAARCWAQTMCVSKMPCFLNAVRLFTIC